ncbi:MAG: 3-dehydroquinate synthase II [Desulfovibrionaceae bacterium]
MKIFFRVIPYNKESISLALEQGVKNFVVEEEYKEEVENIARCTVRSEKEIQYVTLREQQDEIRAIEHIEQGKFVVINSGWEIIPLENIVARNLSVFIEVQTKDECDTARGILERGVAGVIIQKEHSQLLLSCKEEKEERRELSSAIVSKIEHVGMGHRVCIDTSSLLLDGEGMLVGNNSGFFFLVQAETLYNEYVNPRPFRVNAGSVHSYILCPKDTTRYLSEVKSATEVVLCTKEGDCSRVVVGRSKIERRPMLAIYALCDGIEGVIFLQNAETVALMTKNGEAKSVVAIAEGDEILVCLDTAGRHFGMRVEETILE